MSTQPYKKKKLKFIAPAISKKIPFDQAECQYIGLEHIQSWTGQIDMNQEELPEGVVSLFEPNDILFGKLRPYLAKVALVPFSGSCSTEALVLRPMKSHWPPYIRYVLSEETFIDEVNASTFGAKMPRASWEFIGSRKIPAPDIDTQKDIADFLDRETTRIDQFIKRKGNFLGLIQEKKAALMVKAVDGSLVLSESPNGEVGWFGQLPSSWPVRRSKVLFRESQARSISGEEELLTVSHLTGVTRRSDKDVNMFMAESLEGYKLVQVNDVAVNTMWAWMGAMGVSPVEGVISPSYAVYRPITEDYEPKYLDLLLRSAPFVAEVNRRSKGVWSSRLRLYPDAFLDIRFPVPPRDSQKQILETLKQTTSREERIAKLSQQSIERLKEFRSALITAAVTGQIDVTTWGKQGNTEYHLDKLESEVCA
jgi:type I restriction enzyme, S subunit